MAALVVVVGVLLIGLTLWDAFSTMVLPRTVFAVFRPSRTFIRVSWRAWRVMSNLIRARRTRQTFIAFFGPLAVFLLLAFWAGTIIIAFTLLHFDLETQVQAPSGPNRFTVLLYLMFTVAPWIPVVDHGGDWLKIPLLDNPPRR